jgi:LacI family transcriptional regulator
MPTIVLNNMIPEPINCIAIENKKAAQEVTEHLISLGHTRIATIAGDMATQAGQMRLEGFKEVLRKHNIKISKEYITYGDFLRTPARLAAEKLLKLRKRPTAIFAASDVMALELIDVARKKDISIPKDLSVIGFDDNPLNTTSSVKLTTVPQPLIEMGRLGVENLHQVSKGTAKLPIKLMLSTRLHIRSSTRKISR